MLVAAVFAAFLAGFVAGSQVSPTGLLGRKSSPPAHAELIGTWQVPPAGVMFEFRSDGTGAYIAHDGMRFLYHVEGNKLLLGEIEDEDVLEFRVEGDVLTLPVYGMPHEFRRVR